MGMQCSVCGKKPVLGNQKTYRGKAKYLGGVGKKITGITKRTFKPNLQRIQVVVDGVTGLTVPARDPDALAQALERILYEPGLADRLGFEGHRQLRENASWEVVAERVESALDAERGDSGQR